MAARAIHRVLGPLAAVAAIALAPAAEAEVLVAQSRTSYAIYGGASYSVDFNGGSAGGTSFSFTTSQANTRIVVMFNAECAVDGGTGKYVEIDLLVDPAGATGETQVAPSNGDNAFCSGNGTTLGLDGSDGWVSAAVIGSIVLPTAGSHTVRVRVNGGNAGIARLDDMSLIVMR